MHDPISRYRGRDVVVYLAPDLFAVLVPGPCGIRRVLAVDQPSVDRVGELLHRLLDALTMYAPTRVLVSRADELLPGDAFADALDGTLSEREAHDGFLLHRLPDVRTLAAALLPAKPPDAAPPSFPPRLPPLLPLFDPVGASVQPAEKPGQEPAQPPAYDRSAPRLLATA